MRSCERSERRSGAQSRCCVLARRLTHSCSQSRTLAASSFGFFYYQAKYQDTQYDTILVATVTVGFLVVGLLGITYSLFSANWDGDGGGSVDDFKQNLGSVQQGLRRGLIDNPKLREEALNMEEVSAVSEASQQHHTNSPQKKKRTSLAAVTMMMLCAPRMFFTRAPS